jgi:hypothetical protein
MPTKPPKLPIDAAELVPLASIARYLQIDRSTLRTTLLAEGVPVGRQSERGPYLVSWIAFSEWYNANAPRIIVGRGPRSPWLLPKNHFAQQ